MYELIVAVKSFYILSNTLTVVGGFALYVLIIQSSLDNFISGYIHFDEIELKKKDRLS